ncbi:MAG: hypothetical protein LBI79_11140 [Nitrososphaerota archaeon]|jgi:uncharacterized repeat protein (TIGR02543 family)|nr:hypothetical protein [Nitrososphaerota archaeon]
MTPNTKNTPFKPHKLKKTLLLSSLLIILFTSTFTCLLTTEAASPYLFAKTETELRDIINNAMEHTAIALTTDIELTHALTIPKGKNITLTSINTEFFKLTNTYTGTNLNDGNTINIEGGGTLEIANINITRHPETFGTGVAIWYGSTLTMTSGAICGHNDQGVYILHSNFHMSGGIISDNTASDGAGVFNYEGNFSMSGGTISDNTASNNGGGIYNLAGNLSITGGIISNNIATSGNGGGIYNLGNNSHLSLLNGVISNNNARNGGGVYINAGNFTATDSAISNNTANNGGGIYLNTGSFTVFDSAISGNRARNGGGVYIVNSHCELFGGELFANTASNDGGGVWIAIEQLNRLVVHDRVVFSDNIASVAYDRAPLHDAVYLDCISAEVTWSAPFIQGYNNYDISYTNGTSFTFYTVTVNGSHTESTGAGSYQAGVLVTVNAGTQPGYHFLNWTVNAGGVALPNTATAAFIMPANNVTVTANWAIIPAKYSIVYVLNDGINAAANPAVYTANDLPLGIIDPSKSNCTFAGWTVTIDGVIVETMVKSFIISAGTTGNIALSATWTHLSPKPIDAYNTIHAEFNSYYNPVTGQFRWDLFDGYTDESILEAEQIMAAAGYVHTYLLAAYGRLGDGCFSADDTVEVIKVATHILTQAIADMNTVLKPKAPALFADVYDMGNLIRVWFSYPIEIEHIAATVDGQAAKFDGTILSGTKIWLPGVGYIDAYSNIAVAKINNWQSITLTLTANGQTLMIELINDRYEPPIEWTTTVIEPTCTLEGYTELCYLPTGEIWRSDYVPALGHDFEVLYREGDYLHVSCIVCGWQDYVYDPVVNNSLAVLWQQLIVLLQQLWSRMALAAK